MVWPDPPNDPRPDSRNVLFNMGHFWGRLPHTRIAVVPSSVDNQFSWMDRGVLLQSNEPPNDPSFSVGNTFEGFATLDGIDWRFIYRWNYVAYPDVMGIQFTATKLTPTTGTIFYRQTGTATMSPEASIVMPIFSNVPGWSPRPESFTKYDLPEWIEGDVAYPGIVITDPA